MPSFVFYHNNFVVVTVVVILVVVVVVVVIIVVVVVVIRTPAGKQLLVHIGIHGRHVYGRGRRTVVLRLRFQYQGPVVDPALADVVVPRPCSGAQILAEERRVFRSAHGTSDHAHSGGAFFDLHVLFQTLETHVTLLTPSLQSLVGTAATYQTRTKRVYNTFISVAATAAAATAAVWQLAAVCPDTSPVNDSASQQMRFGHIQQRVLGVEDPYSRRRRFSEQRRQAITQSHEKLASKPESARFGSGRRKSHQIAREVSPEVVWRLDADSFRSHHEVESAGAGMGVLVVHHAQRHVDAAYFLDASQNVLDSQEISPVTLGGHIPTEPGKKVFYDTVNRV